jgi:heterodisulfide reductase subunit B
MDFLPNQIVHMVELGMKDEILKSKTIWLCAECQTCVTRCPNDVDIPTFMEVLKRLALKEGVEAAEKNVPLFNKAFLDSIRKKGRIHELGMMRQYKMQSGDLFSDIKLGFSMFRKGKLKIFGGGAVKGIKVQLALRNMALADKAGMELVISCAGCFSRMRWARETVAKHPELAGGIPYEGKANLLFLLDLFNRKDIAARIRQSVVRPLKGLKVAGYYGCVIVRPPGLSGMEDYENPQSIERVMRTVGAEPVDWPYKTDCCSSDLGIPRPDVQKALVGKLLDMAGEAGADALVTACPLCFANLDPRQDEILSEGLGKVKMPVFFFTELIGHALGLPESKKWWGKHFVDPQPLLAQRGL